MFGFQNLSIPGVIAFHQSGSRIRLLSANNRGGKSTRGAWELVCFATGYHPIRRQKYPTPNICWAVSLDNKNYGHIIEARLREWLPLGTKWEEGKRRFILPAPWKSIIYLKSAEPGETKFAAEGILAAWFDEGREAMEKPFQETLARIKPGWPLNLFMTMTPEDGVGGWTWRKFYDPESKERYPGAEIFYFNIYECSTEKGGHLSPDEIEQFIGTIPPWKRDAKVYGRPGAMASDPYHRPDFITRTQKRSPVATPGYLETDAMGAMRFKPSDDGDIWMLEKTKPGVFPVPGRTYIMPIDMGGGVSKDYTVAAILDPVDKKEVAYFKSNEIDPEHATLSRIIPLGKFFNRALAIPETNGEHGAMHITVLRAARYSPIYRPFLPASIKRRMLEVYGWRTYGPQRNIIYDSWKKMLHRNDWTISNDALNEAKIISEKDGYPDHPQGRHNDHYFAVGIGLAALELKPNTGKKYAPTRQPMWFGEEQYAV